MTITPNSCSVIFACLMFAAGTCAQSKTDPPKLELGAQFSSLTIAPSDFFKYSSGRVFSGPSQTEPGFGGRFTFNLNKNIALEAQGNFFPHRNSSGLRRGGTLLQGQFGVKIGKRFQRFGLFGTVLPGFVSFSQVTSGSGTGGIIVGPADLHVGRKSHFSTEVGGVVEFYPSRRIVMRFDAGDTMIHYARLPQPTVIDVENPVTDTSARVTHNFQLSSGVGFRLIAPKQNEIATPRGQRTRRRFEVGGQFSSLTFSIREHYLSLDSLFYYKKSDVGFGGRFGYNVTDRIAIEAETNFLSGDVNNTLNNGRVGGRPLQVQAGVKAGKRFDRFGIFGKARPGIVSFSKTLITDSVVFNNGVGPFTNFHYARRTYFSIDLGGVLEFYPSKKIVTRVDAGDTMIRYSRALQGFILNPFEVPAETLHNFQFSSRLAFRF